MTKTSPGPHNLTCKCCGCEAAYFGEVDFSKNCLERKGVKLSPAGIAVPYFRCVVCGFIFTAHFDAFTTEEMNDQIYNDDYAQVDPDWKEARPRHIAKLVIEHFGAHKGGISILDYGCGNGRVGELLQLNGFGRVTGYDPQVAAFSTPPVGRFDLIVCFEVLEHLTDPVSACREIAALRADDGLVFHSTLLQPEDILTLGLEWWYAAPRNGHVSLFSADSLNVLWRRFGMQVKSLNRDVHVAYDGVPEFGRQVINAS